MPQMSKAITSESQEYLAGNSFMKIGLCFWPRKTMARVTGGSCKRQSMPTSAFHAFWNSNPRTKTTVLLCLFRIGAPSPSRTWSPDDIRECYVSWHGERCAYSPSRRVLVARFEFEGASSLPEAGWGFRAYTIRRSPIGQHILFPALAQIDIQCASRSFTAA